MVAWGMTDREAVQQEWIVGVASVIFDIDQGQRVESLHPAGILSTAEERDVAFHCERLILAISRHLRCTDSLERVIPVAKPDDSAIEA